MNISVFGRVPTPAQAQQLGYVRLVPIWRRYPHYNETFERALNRVKPITDAYKLMGVKIILALTQEMGLDGQGYDYNNLDLNRFVSEYLDLAEKWINATNPAIVQIMNEMDDPTGRASIRFTPPEYGRLFAAAYGRLKPLGVQVWTGGFNQGVESAKRYFGVSGITRTDGLALHPYGVSHNGDFGQFGRLDTFIREAKKIGVPIGFSEFGVLGLPDAAVNRVAAYARTFTEYARAQGVVFTCWFDWASGDSGAHQGYGLLNPDGSLRQSLFDALHWPVAPDNPEPTGNAVWNATINIRAAPSVTAEKLGVIPAGKRATITAGKLEIATPYLWIGVEYDGVTGWSALALDKTVRPL